MSIDQVTDKSIRVQRFSNQLNYNMRSGRAVSIGLVALVLASCLVYVRLPTSDQRNLRARLEQLEKEEGWRVLVGNLGIYCLDIRTASLTPVYVLPESQFNGSYVGMASFSPDGTKITFGQNWGNERALMVYDLIQRRNEAVSTMAYLEGARWSPSGNEIAFRGRPTHTGKCSLYVYRLREKRLSLLVDPDLMPGEFMFSWGPGGEGIVSQDSENNIWIIDLNKKTHRRLDKGWGPTWSPNGRFIAYGLEDAYHKGYIVYDLQTDKKESILAGKLAAGSLVWSPDSRYLVYTGVSGGFWDHMTAFFGETRYGDLYVIDVESKVEVKVYGKGRAIFPTDWAKTSALK